jgi:hypothetical protein
VGTRAFFTAKKREIKNILGNYLMFEGRCAILYFMPQTTRALDTHYNVRGGAPYSDQITGGGIPSFADRMTGGGLGGFLLALVGGARNFRAAAGADGSLMSPPPPPYAPLGQKVKTL